MREWQKVVILAILVVGAIVALFVARQESGEAIAYMFAGAAANQGAVSLDHNKSKDKHNDPS